MRDTETVARIAVDDELDSILRDLTTYTPGSHPGATSLVEQQGSVRGLLREPGVMTG